MLVNYWEMEKPKAFEKNITHLWQVPTHKSACVCVCQGQPPEVVLWEPSTSVFEIGLLTVTWNSCIASSQRLCHPRCTRVCVYMSVLDTKLRFTRSCGSTFLTEPATSHYRELLKETMAEREWPDDHLGTLITVESLKTLCVLQVAQTGCGRPGKTRRRGTDWLTCRSICTPGKPMTQVIICKSSDLVKQDATSNVW